jgi:hypothetical protein
MGHLGRDACGAVLSVAFPDIVVQHSRFQNIYHRDTEEWELKSLTTKKTERTEKIKASEPWRFLAGKGVLRLVASLLAQDDSSWSRGCLLAVVEDVEH